MHKISAIICLLSSMLLTTTGSPQAQDEGRDYEKAREAYEAREYPETLIYLKNALQRNPDNIPARLLLAQLYLNMGDIYGAEKESAEALLLGADINLVLPVYGSSLVLQKKLDELFEIERSYGDLTRENRFEWALLKGQGYLLNGEPELAIAEYEKAAEMYPTSVRAKNTLASLYARYQRFDEAEQLVEQSLTLDPADEKTWLLKGSIAMGRGDPVLARKHLEKAHELDSNDPKILRSLARLHMEQGNDRELKHYLKLILDSSPDDPAATLLTAMMILDQESDQAMGEEMLKNLSIKLSDLEESGYQGDENTMFIRATADYVQKNDEAARTLLITYLRKNRGDLAAIRMLTDLYLRNGERSRATELLSDRREYVIEDFALTLQLIYLYIEKKNTLGAQETIEEIKRRAGGHPQVVMLEAEYLRAGGQAASALALLNGQDFGEDEPLAYGLLRGKLELALKKYPSATASVKRLEKLYPEAIRVNNFAAVTYLHLKELDKAAIYVDKALQLDPENFNARFNRASLLKYRGDYEAASTELNAILAEQPSHTSSILLMASIMFDQQRYEDAIEWSKKVLNYEPQSSRPGELQLAIYKHTENWKKALEVALQLTRQDRLNTDFLVELAEVYIALKQYESAQRPLYKLYSLWEDNAQALRTLARLQIRSQNLPAARKSLERALQMNMRAFGVRLDLARLALTEGNPDEAAKAVASLKKEMGERTQLALLQADIYLAKDKPQLAQGEFRRAYELDMANTAALIQLYQLSLQGIGAEEFTELLEASLRKEAQPPWVVRLLADSYLAQGKDQEAARHYEALLGVPGLRNSDAILNNLANIYSREDLDKALATAMIAIDSNGRNNWALLDTVGWIMSRQKRYEEALPYFREAYTMNSRNPEIRYHTGVTLLALGKKTEAEKELRAALALGKEFPGSADARLMIEGLQ